MIEFDRIGLVRTGEELVKMRTATSKTFALPNDQFNLKMGKGILHYAEGSQLEDIDLEPEDLGNQMQLIKAPYKLEISKGGLEVIYRANGAEITLSLESIDGTAPIMNGQSKLHDHGHCLHFENVLGDGCLFLVFKAGGIHTEQVIRSGEGIRTLKWNVSQNISEPIVKETYKSGKDAAGRKAEISVNRTALRKQGKMWHHSFEERFTGNVLKVADKKTRKLKAHDKVQYPIRIVT